MFCGHTFWIAICIDAFHSDAMELKLGDCLSVLKQMDADSVDSLITDPPAGISFMGKAWDDDKGGRLHWIGWMTLVMAECKRVLKPGAHGLVWAIPRTSHWTATACEEAGFEVRDVVTHLFGSGFPKSLDVSKAIDKMAGAEREVVGENPNNRDRSKHVYNSVGNVGSSAFLTAPSTDAAKQWAGWGTALKPASEHWILVRKPCSEKTVAANVLKWGTGALNIDASRVGLEGFGAGGGSKVGSGKGVAENASGIATNAKVMPANPAGRFPANLVLSHSEYCTDDQCDIECAVHMLDEQSGNLKGPGNKKPSEGNKFFDSDFKARAIPGVNCYPGQQGGASRFFYVAKVSSRERNAGLEGMPDKLLSRMITGSGKPSESVKERASEGMPNRFTSIQKNSHPTVKPQKLMRYLCKMITPPGGTVLDPFMGSGSTGLAAKSEGFQFIGIEREQEYFEIAGKRISSALNELALG